MGISKLVAALGFASVVNAACDFSKDKEYTFADIHDGDKKMIKIGGPSNDGHTFATITSGTPDEKWSVMVELDEQCTGMLDFKGSGKPKYPPVPLLMELHEVLFIDGTSDYPIQFAVTFSDPSGTIGPKDKDVYLNAWIMVGETDTTVLSDTACPDHGSHGESQQVIMYDMHDGDMKQVLTTVQKVGVHQPDTGIADITITSTNASQPWVVKPKLDKQCKGMVDFFVPYKPSPPPVPIFMRTSILASVPLNDTVASGLNSVPCYIFHDTSGQIAPANVAINVWLPKRMSSLSAAAVAAAPVEACDSSSETDCDALTGCTWCKSGAIPSKCYTDDLAKKLPAGVFDCGANGAPVMVV